LINGAKTDSRDSTHGFNNTPLHQLIIDEQEELAQFYLAAIRKHRCPIDLRLTDFEGKTVLLTAIKVGLTDIAEILLEMNPSCANIADNHGALPLHYACALGFVDIAEKLILTGAQINERDEFGQTPLHYSVFMKSQIDEIYQSVSVAPNRDIGAKHNVLFLSHQQPLVIDLDSPHGYPDIKELIFNTTATKNSKSHRELLLHTINIPLIRYIVNNKMISYDQMSHINDQLRNLRHESRTEYALRHQLNIVSLLLSNYADPRITNSTRAKPAFLTDNLEIIALLEENETFINSRQELVENKLPKHNVIRHSNNY